MAMKVFHQDELEGVLGQLSRGPLNEGYLQLTFERRVRHKNISKLASMDSDLEAFSRNPRDGSFVVLASSILSILIWDIYKNCIDLYIELEYNYILFITLYIHIDVYGDF